MSGRPADLELAVLIPAWNERENLELLLPALRETLDGLGVRWEIIVADGGSRDGTAEAATRRGARVIQQRRPGYGAALTEAMAASQASYVVTMDADLSHRPTFIEDLWRHREEAEVLIASRYVPGGQSQTHWLRRLCSRILNMTYTRLLSLPVQDISSGFRMYRRDILQGLQCRARDFDILEEILIKVHALGFCIRELPFRYLSRGTGRSHARFLKFGWAYLKTLIRMWQLRNSVASADYDHRAFNSPIPLQRYWQRARHRIILGFLGSASRQGAHAILDIGCGSSRIIQDLPHAVGMDILLPKLRFLRDRHSGLAQGNVFALPFPAHTFDAVICSEVIEHIPDHPSALDEMTRVLRPGGTLILGTPDYGRWLWWVLEWIYGKILPGGYAHEHITHFTRASLSQRLTTSGYTIQDLKYVGFCEMIFRARRPGAPLTPADPFGSGGESTLTTEADALPKLPAVDPSSTRSVRNEALRVGPWTMLLVLLLAVAAYVDSLRYQFIWDDILMVVQNPVLQDLRNLPEFLRADFTRLTSGAIEGHYYRPTLAVTLALDSTVWGLNPAGFHLTNILLHAVVTFLVSRLVLAVGATRNVAVLAALVFAIHPVHVEAVAWVAARVDLLASIGVLGCLVAYRRWGLPGPGQSAWGLAALGCQGFALLSKESSVILPALLVSSDLLCSGRPGQPAAGATWRRALIRSLPFWAVTALFAAFRSLAFLHIAGNRLQGGDLWRRLPGALEILARYLRSTLVPTHMQPLYALARPSSFLEPWPVLGILAAVLLVALLVWWWRRAPLAAFGVAWFLVTVLPVVDLVPFSLREMALTDRYLYLPSVGISLLLALGITTLMGPVADRAVQPRRLVAWGALIVLLTVYPWHLLRYARAWQNDLTLYGRMVQVAPASPMANFNFGFALLRANDLPHGTAALERAVGLDPRLPRPRAILALAYVLQGRTDDGFRIFDSLASEGPTEREYYVSRTVAHLFMGEWQEALVVAEDGARRFPGDADLAHWLGTALEKAGRSTEAVEKYRRAISLRPDLYQAEEALAHLLAQSGKPDEATQHFLRSAKIRPDRVQPIRALALLLEAQGNPAESLRLWRQVLELAPNGSTIQEAAANIHRLETGGTRPGLSPQGFRPPGAPGS